MSDSILPRMDWSNPDLSGAIKMFKQRCELYFSVKDIKKEKQVDHILLFIGEEGIKMFNSWGLTDAQKKDPEEVWKRFQTQAEPKSNFRVARLYLHSFKQQENESIDAFVSRCKLQAMKCDCQDSQDRIM